MLSQFTREGGHMALCDLDFEFPKDVYPVGRLDQDSEGLLLLTNDNILKNKVLDPKSKQPKTYWVQVDGQIAKEAILELEKGVLIKHKGKSHITMPAKCQILDKVDIPERNPPIRFRKNIPTSWLEVQIMEGKNRQVRKMTAAVGFPTLRLIRVAIGKLIDNSIESGAVKEYSQNEIYNLLELN